MSTGNVARWTASEAVLPSAIPAARDSPWLATTSRSDRDAASSRIGRGSRPGRISAAESLPASVADLTASRSAWSARSALMVA